MLLVVVFQQSFVSFHFGLGFENASRLFLDSFHASDAQDPQAWLHKLSA